MQLVMHTRMWALVAGLALLLAGCGKTGQSQSKPASTPAAAQAQSGQSGASAAPVTANSQPGAQSQPVFVLNSQDATVSVLDPQTWQLQSQIQVGKEPHHLYMTPDEKSVVVANALGNTLTFIDPVTAKVQRTVSDILDPYHLRFSPDMQWFVTAANRLNHVDIYRWDGKELALQKRLNTGKTPSHLWIDSKSTTVYASIQDDDKLTAIDLKTQKELWTIPVGKMPADVFGTRDDKYLLVGLTGSNGYEVYDVSGAQPVKVKFVKTADGAHAFRAAGDGKHVFMSNRAANSISKIDLSTLEPVAMYPAPGGPDCMDVSADGKRLMVTSRWARKLTVIDLESGQVARQIDVGRSPHGVWTLDHAKRT